MLKKLALSSKLSCNGRRDTPGSVNGDSLCVFLLCLLFDADVKRFYKNVTVTLAEGKLILVYRFN